MICRINLLSILVFAGSFFYEKDMNKMEKVALETEN